MAAFDRINSGIPQMDSAFDNIRLGDNVVWQVSKLEEFRVFSEPFVKQAIKEHRNLIYIRFASHEPFIEAQPGVKICNVRLSHHFETFSVEIHNIIETEGRDAFYVFDCLSELQTKWSTDLMMSNFFILTCPLLFDLDTVAYFPIIRGRHSFDAIAKIRETTQLLMDVYDAKWNDTYYVHPLKVWERYSPTMFLPHAYHRTMEEFHALTTAVSVSRYYTVMGEETSNDAGQDLDSWDRFFSLARLQYDNGMLKEGTLRAMCSNMMTKDTRLQKMILKNFQPEDFFTVRKRMVGSGMIGGKACGMLLARKIIENTHPEYRAHFEPHDSFYIGSDVFYTYIVQNDCWNMRLRQRTDDEYFEVAPQLAESLKSGRFPQDIREQFRRMLENFGQSPIIVRSSSILEDGFGNAFAGKYDSVFCINKGEPEERLKAFEDAVRTVYASTMSQSALEYRKQRGLDKRDEQMALLVQRVSGSWYDSTRFMPTAAGVGFSYSAYRFMEDMDPTSGMLRIVMGLGTRAVDRTEGDYPRLMSMSDPLARTAATVAERHRYSQHKVDVLDTTDGHLSEQYVEKLRPLLADYEIRSLLEHDTEAEYRFRERGEYRNIYFVSCQGLAKNKEFTGMMKTVMATLQRNYESPVDIEYTLNLDQNDDFVVNLLQCRPLQVCVASEQVTIPDRCTLDTYFHLKGTTMGRSRREKIDVVVSVDPRAYYEWPYMDKPRIARVIGQINAYYKHSGKKMMLLVPGRIGTSSPELGVPVVFANISAFSVICEVAYSEVGYMPELSFGSHMFQDLVESDILYCAIFENKKTQCWHPDFLNTRTNRYTEICPENLPLEKMIQVVEFDDLMLFHNMEEEEVIAGIETEGIGIIKE